MGGGTMPGKPLELPWSEMLGHPDNSAAEVQVSGRGGEEEKQGEINLVRNLSDHELGEKIERMKTQIGTGFASRLRDKGAKFRAHIVELEEERKRRKKASVPDKDIKCKGDIISHDAVSSEYGRSFCPSSLSQPGSSFTYRVNQNISGKTDIDTYSEKQLSVTPESKNIKKENGPKYSEGDEKSPPLRKSSSCNRKDVASSSYSKSDTGGSRSSPISKRTRSHKNNELQPWDWIKTEEVVLLDDEDVLPLKKAKEGQEVDGWKEAKIYFPSRDHPEFVEIFYSDIKCLDPESYLSSTIMNFYIQYLQNPASLIGRPVNEYHFFNTYFYKKLEKAVSCKVDKNENFSKLRRWLKGVNIFQKAYVFLPIHGDLHWSLVIICIPAKEDESGPIILHLDSLGFHTSNAIFENTEIYLKEEWKHIYQNASPTDIPISEKIWDYLPRFIKKKKIMVPQQKNEYDCGLFVLYFMERFIEEAPERIKSKDLAKFGNKWFQPEEASGLRKRIQELLVKEFKSVALENKTKESPTSSERCQEVII